MAYKYPFIADKHMYAAVMFACKLIRETGYFSKAVQTSANYYGVDEDELKKHIRERQAVGQKGKVKGRKYRWFILRKGELSDTLGYLDHDNFSIVRATNQKNATMHYSDIDFRETRDNDYGGSYAAVVFHFVIGNEDGYATKKEAQEALKELKKKGE